MFLHFKVACREFIIIILYCFLLTYKHFDKVKDIIIKQEWQHLTIKEKLKKNQTDEQTLRIYIEWLHIRYLTAKGIILQSLTSIGQFKHALINVESYGRTDGPILIIEKLCLKSILQNTIKCTDRQIDR